MCQLHYRICSNNLELLYNCVGDELLELCYITMQLGCQLKLLSSIFLLLSVQYGIYMHLCEDVVQIIYTPLEASAVGNREVHGCTPIHDPDGSTT